MAEQSKKPLTAKEKERKEETSKAANKALEAQKKAKELTQAAAAAGDPEERQKLLNQALEKEVEAETFGKTAKYLQSGAFQGLCAGAGIGGSIGVSLGVLTGTLVGGTTGIVTGGLGAGIGLGVGALHGPWFKVGELMGSGIRKITGDIPGWKATEEQKNALEKMINGVREQDRPNDEELVQMSEEGGKVEVGKGYVGQRKEDEQQKSALQGMKPDLTSPLSTSKSKKASAGAQPKSKVQGLPNSNTQADGELRDRYAGLAGEAATSATQAPKASPKIKKQPRKLEIRSQKATAA